MGRGEPRTPLRFGRGAVEKWPTTPSFWALTPGHGARCPADGPVSRADHPPPGLPASPCRFAHLARQQVGFDRPRSAAPLGEGSPGQGELETPPGRLSTAEGPAGPGQPGGCATPLPVFPSCRTASRFWPSQGHHPRSGRRQSGQNRPRTPPDRPSAAEGPAGSGQPATCSPARLPALSGGKPVPTGLKALSPLGQATPRPEWP